MAAYARTPSALTWLHGNHLINGLHKQISCKNCLYAVNSYFTIWFAKISAKIFSYETGFVKTIPIGTTIEIYFMA